MPPPDIALALSARFIRLRSEDAEAMTKWDELTDEDEARLREVGAEQRADEEMREAEIPLAEREAAHAVAEKEAWEELPLAIRGLIKSALFVLASVAGVLGLAVWLLVLVVVGVLVGIIFLLLSLLPR
jgi:Flp pilus assembly protein TadB